MKERVAVIGGGISGLSAAYFAQKKGYAVDLYERTDQLGGLAGSFDFDGLTIDKFYHFICGADQKLISFAHRLGLGDKIRFAPTKSALFYNNKYYPFGTHIDLLRFSPISLISRLKFGLNTVLSKYRRDWIALDTIPAKDWLIRRLGEKAYEVIWDPLLRVKFGKVHDKISAAWIWHRINRVASSRRTPLSREKMGFFLEGTKTLIDKLVEKIKESGGLIYMNSDVQGIKKAVDTFDLFMNEQKKSGYNKVIIAVPLPMAAELVKPLHPEYAHKLSSIEFIGIVCGIFRLKTKVSEAFWLNINDPRMEANGLIEYTNLNSLQGKTEDNIVYIPFYVAPDNKWYVMDENTMQYEMVTYLKLINPDLSEDNVIGFRAFRSPYAQAVCTVGFMKKMPPVSSPINDLYILDSTQVYPSDRTLDSLIRLAEKTVGDNL